MEIGIAYDLRSDFPDRGDGPEDRLEEYDSESTVEAIARALEGGGHRSRLLGGGRRFLRQVMDHPPDLVFNIAEGHGSRSREAHVPGACEMLGIPFTHSDPLTLAVSLDKGVAKRIVASHGVPTPRFAVLDGDPGCGAGDEAAAAAVLQGLRYPVIAKPLFEGSSMGVRKTSRVASRTDLQALIATLRRDYGQPVLVEEFLPGAEFTVGVLGTGRGARVVGVMEIVPRRAPLAEFVYSLEVKRNYTEEVEYRVPPDRPAALITAIGEVALGACRALECRDIARVDVRLAADGSPHFLEVNPLPGLNPVTGDIVILSGRMGVSFPELILGVVASARARCGI